jgi:hypothetical protein
MTVCLCVSDFSGRLLFEEMAGPQQQTKRGAENEAQPAPVAKRVTQEPEEEHQQKDNDIQDAGAVQPPSPEQTNHEEVLGATNQEEVPPPAGDEAHDASEDLEQAAKEVTANKGEAAKASEEALKEATEETSHENDQTKVSQESVQNGVGHTSVEEDANEPGKVVKEINTVASTVAV